MRARALAAAVAAAFALGLGAAPAGAADLPLAPRGYVRSHHFVPMRAYWREHGRYRHYYPATGRKPAVGRDENPAAGGRPPRMAENFARSWSASSVFAADFADLRGRDIEGEPPLK